MVRFRVWVKVKVIASLVLCISPLRFFCHCHVVLSGVIEVYLLFCSGSVEKMRVGFRMADGHTDQLLQIY